MNILDYIYYTFYKLQIKNKTGSEFAHSFASTFLAGIVFGYLFLLTAFFMLNFLNIHLNENKIVLFFVIIIVSLPFTLVYKKRRQKIVDKMENSETKPDVKKIKRILYFFLIILIFVFIFGFLKRFILPLFLKLISIIF